LHEAIQEVINHRYVYAFTNIEILLNGQIQDYLDLVELKFLFQLVFRLTDNPQDEVYVGVSLLTQDFVDQGKLALVRV
jgi:hypothetical protein